MIQCHQIRDLLVHIIHKFMRFSIRFLGQHFHWQGCCNNWWIHTHTHPFKNQQAKPCGSTPSHSSQPTLLQEIRCQWTRGARGRKLTCACAGMVMRGGELGLGHGVVWEPNRSKNRRCFLLDGYTHGSKHVSNGVHWINPCKSPFLVHFCHRVQVLAASSPALFTEMVYIPSKACANIRMSQNTQDSWC